MDSAKDYDQNCEDFYEDEYGDDDYDYDGDADYEDPYEDYETPWRMSWSEFVASRAMIRVGIDPSDPGWSGIFDEINSRLSSQREDELANRLPGNVQERLGRMRSLVDGDNIPF